MDERITKLASVTPTSTRADLRTSEELIKVIEAKGRKIVQVLAVLRGERKGVNHVPFAERRTAFFLWGHRRVDPHDGGL